MKNNTLRLVRKLATVALSLACGLSPALAAAPADLGGENLLFMNIPTVVTATRTQQSSFKAPATVTVVTEKDILASGARTLFELLGRLNGITVSRNSIGRPRISMRGITSNVDNDKFKLMVNGHAIAEPMWNSFGQFFDTSLDNVKQVEIVRGPGSALYGAGAFAGTINIITKTGAEVQGTKATVKYGSFNTTNANIEHGRQVGDFEYGFNANYVRSDGAHLTQDKDQYTGLPVDIAPGPTSSGQTRYQTDVNMKYRQFSLNGSFMHVDQNMLIPELGSLTQGGEETTYTSGYAELKHDLPITDALTLKSRVSYDGLHNNNYGMILPVGFGYSMIGLPVPGFYTEGGHGDYGFSSDEYKAESVADYHLTNRNELLVGVFYEQDKTRDIFYRGDGHPLLLVPLGAMTDFSNTLNWNKPMARTIYGSFFQDEWNLREDWYLIAGARYDKYTDVGEPFSTESFNVRPGLVWNFKPNQGTAKLLYGTATRAPNFTELYNQNSPALVGNPNLKPETLESTELAVNYIFSDRLESDLSIYRAEMNNTIDISTERLTPGGPLFYKNIGQRKFVGTELGEKYTFKKNTYVYASYSYTHAKDVATDTFSTNVPEHQVTVRVNLPLYDHWIWNTDMIYTGLLRREPGDTRDAARATAVANTTLRYENFHGADIFFSVYNLTDERVVSPSFKASAPMTDLRTPGVSFSGGVSYKF